MRYAIAIIVITFASSFFSKQPILQNMTPVFKDTISPWTEYYNLSGNLVRKAKGEVRAQRIVLTKNEDKNSVDRFIKSGYVIAIPSKPLIDSLKECYYRTDTSKFENGFTVGQSGKISYIVEGMPSEIQHEDRMAYFENLKAQKDKPAFDVHSHPVVFRKRMYNDQYRYGTGTASPDDIRSQRLNDFKKNYNYHYIYPSIVLGFEPDSSRMQGDSFIDPIVMLQYIGFYDSHINITCLKFDDFIKAVEKIIVTVD